MFDEQGPSLVRRWTFLPYFRRQQPFLASSRLCTTTSIQWPQVLVPSPLSLLPNRLSTQHYFPPSIIFEPSFKFDSELMWGLHWAFTIPESLLSPHSRWMRKFIDSSWPPMLLLLFDFLTSSFLPTPSSIRCLIPTNPSPWCSIMYDCRYPFPSPSSYYSTRCPLSSADPPSKVVRWTPGLPGCPVHGRKSRPHLQFLRGPGWMPAMA